MSTCTINTPNAPPERTRWPTRVLGFSFDMILDLNTSMIEEMARRSHITTFGYIAAGSLHNMASFIRIIDSRVEFAREDIQEGKTVDVKKLLDTISKATNNLATLCNNLYDYKQGKRSSKSVVDLCSVAKQAIELIRPTTPKNISINFSQAGDTIKAFANEDQVTEMLVNLIRNGKQAIQNRGGEVTVSVHFLRRGIDEEMVPGSVTESKFVAFSVRDTGVGMSPETFAKISKPFFTTKQDSGGSGLGLLMVKYLAHENNGHVVASTMEHGEDIDKHGSVFTVFLPKANQM